ncbi:MAG: RICIN domain-containing protein [Lachnospiraceae bacterium]|nr:RICIN domain-containing protein [Lachnospiraceae bacterium]
MVKIIQKQLSILLSIMFIVVLCQAFGVIKVQATTVTNRTPITCYTTGIGNINTYKAINGAYSGYICANDKCTILAVYNSGWVKVRYPISKGTKTAYAKSSNFFSNTNFSTSTIKLGRNMIVYRKSNLANSFGTVYGSDSVLIIGNSGGNTQILYPISGGYKLGWVCGNYTSSGDVEVDISDGYYQIKSAMNTNYVIDVYGSSKSDSANVQLYQNFYTTNQAFIIKKHSNGYYTISAVHSNKLLDVYECQTQNGANIIQCGSNGGANQYWKIYRTCDGYYSFKSKLNGLYINVNGGIAENERNIQCYQKNNSLAQKFVLQPVTINGKSYNDGSSVAEQRNMVVNYMNKMATIEWTPRISFTHWSGGRTWYAGTMYKGIPYSQSCRNTTYEYFAKNMYGKQYVGPSGQKTYLGSDCSSAVSMAWRTVNTSFPITSTYKMYPKQSYINAVGNYSHWNLENATEICKRNGAGVMKKAYSALQPGDAVLQNEHIMLVTGRYSNYITVTEQTTYSSSLRSTWRVNRQVTFDTLYANNYIPITLSVW